MTETFLFQLPNFYNMFSEVFVWVVFIASLLFSLFSFFVIQYHLSRYSLDKKSAIIGEAIFTVVSAIFLVIMGFSLFAFL